MELPRQTLLLALALVAAGGCSRDTGERGREPRPQPAPDAHAAQRASSTANSFEEGLRLAKAGELARAEAAFGKACESGHGAACGRHAGLLLESKKYAAAERAARGGCPEHGDVDGSACSNLSVALRRLRRIPEAAAAGKRACAASSASGCAAWAHAALLAQDAATAREALHAALRLSAAGTKNPERASERAVVELRQELTELGAAYPKRSALVERCLRELPSERR
jgi:hypothetical protein